MTTIFFFVSITIPFFRGLTGIADAACWSAVLSLLLQMFPDKVAKTMALTETSFGLGLMIGPALGSLLFEASPDF